MRAVLAKCDAWNASHEAFRPSTLANGPRSAQRDDHEWGRCMLCGPGTQQASAASSRGSSAPCNTPDDGFRPCVLCGCAREQQRAAARAHEVRTLWRLPPSQAQHAFSAVQAGAEDEVERVYSPGPSTAPQPAAPADQADRGRDAHRRRATNSDQADARQARRLEAAEGTRAVMAAERKANAASAKPEEA